MDVLDLSLDEFIDYKISTLNRRLFMEEFNRNMERTKLLGDDKYYCKCCNVKLSWRRQKKHLESKKHKLNEQQIK